ncbi:MAG: hypothetical protein RLY66_498 [Candidatus Parcubacteria bacterium]|jgi:arginyl-tRNA--protein-N-Asp/Glu arginylyltransferase
MNYLHWDEQVITDFSEKNISDMYSRGYVFTRIGKGAMHQTRSVRIDLSAFEPSSENRRILKKIEPVTLSIKTLPFADYDFKLGKLAKDFYDTKFGPGIMSAVKVKEMLTDGTKSNFNTLLAYAGTDPLGYCIAYTNADMLHYSYPFYDLNVSPKDMGLGMMTLAIEHAKNAGLKYIYLGSLQRPTDTYKLQFKGLEWFDGSTWSSDLEKVREILSTEK